MTILNPKFKGCSLMDFHYELNVLKNRINKVRDSVNTCLQTSQLNWAELNDKLNVTSLQLYNLDLELNSSLKSAFLVPEHTDSNPNLIPLVFLRTKLLPEIENLEKENSKDANVTDQDIIQKINENDQKIVELTNQYETELENVSFKSLFIPTARTKMEKTNIDKMVRWISSGICDME